MMHNLANALVENGHNVTIVAKRVGWEGPKEEAAYRLKRFSLPLKGSGKTGIDYCSAIFLVSILNLQRKFDVLNCHGVSYSGGRARALKKLWGLPLVMTPHGLDVQKVSDIGYGLRLDRRWDERISKNLNAADYVTAISQSVRADLDMLPAERIIDIPNGIHVRRFSGEKSDYLREHLNLSGTCRVLLSVGRNHIKKGYDYGIKTVSRLVYELGYHDVHYVIIGRGVTEHRELVTECQVEKFVSLIEEVPAVRITQCYKSADIFFSPSIVEGLSLVSIEAMAASLPLIVTNVPGNEDIVKDNGCGIIVKNQDVESMAQGVLQLLENDARRLELAELSAIRSTRYDWSHIARMYEEVYRRAVEDCGNEHKQKG